MRRTVPFLLGWAAGLVTPLVVYLAHEAASKLVEHRDRHYCANCLLPVRLIDGQWEPTETSDLTCQPGQHRVNHYVKGHNA